MDLSMTSIGTRIKTKRKELNLTQTDIFQQCGLSSGALSHIENGTRTPSVLIFYKLSQVLKCDMEWLITGVSANKQNSIICESEEELLKGFRDLSEEDKEELIEILHLKLRKGKRTLEEVPKSSRSTRTETNDMVG